MIQSLQPKGLEFESTCVLFISFYLYSIRLISFIIDVPRPLKNETGTFYFKRLMRNA